MKSKKFLLITFGFLIINMAGAQDLLTYKTSETQSGSEKPSEAPPVFKFKGYSSEYELEGISSEAAGNHVFGEVISKKLFLFDEKYTSQVAVAPGNPASRTVIKKPVIYESVKRIERDLKRSSRKGEISLAEATRELNIVLDVAISILSADTKDFEQALESSVSTESKIELFTKRVTLVF